MIAGHTAIVAGAGAGKTRTLVERTRQILSDGVPTDRLLVCAFTIAAAEEIRERLDWPDAQVMTLHAFAYTQLQKHADKLGLAAGFDVYSADDATAVRTMVNREVGRPRSPATLKELLAQRMTEANALDYDMLLTGLARLLDTPVGDQIRLATRYLFVDEAQDLDEEQWMVIRALQPHVLVAVGDPRQSIYQWRGAIPAYFTEFSRSSETAATEYLDVNHRSLPEIVEVANHVAKPFDLHDMTVASSASTRQPPAGTPVIEAARDAGDNEALVAAVDRLFAQGFEPKDIAVLGRTWNRVYRAAKSVRIVADVAIAGASRTFWSTEGGVALARYLRLCLSPWDNNLACLLWKHLDPAVDTTQLRIEANEWGSTVFGLGAARRIWPPNASTTSTWEAAEPFVANHLDLDHPMLRRFLTGPRLRTLKSFRYWWSFAQNDWRRGAEDPRITLSTIHGAKGLEWPCVIVLDCDARTFRDRRHPRPDEDRSLLYVALTRARDRLVLLRDEGSEPCRMLPDLTWTAP